jgi:cytochrome c-type biogenesis protein CcmF
MTSAGEDFYLTLLAYDPEAGTVTLRLFVNPLVAWIWVGGAIVVLGALFAIGPGRRPAPAEAA